jgi:hypothetical protein
MIGPNMEPKYLEGWVPGQMHPALYAITSTTMIRDALAKADQITRCRDCFEPEMHLIPFMFDCESGEDHQHAGWMAIEAHSPGCPRYNRVI